MPKAGDPEDRPRHTLGNHLYGQNPDHSHGEDQAADHDHDHFESGGALDLLLKRDYVPTSKKIDTSLNKIPLKFVDPRVVLDERAKRARLYEETFAIRRR